MGREESWRESGLGVEGGGRRGSGGMGSSGERGGRDGEGGHGERRVDLGVYAPGLGLM